jgi:hypothetical protein
MHLYPSISGAKSPATDPLKQGDLLGLKSERFLGLFG